MMGQLFGALAALASVALLCILFRDRGYKAGQKDAWAEAYEQGRKDADNWWIRAEEQIDQARQKIWREGV